jgi:hypothetical protein
MESRVFDRETLLDLLVNVIPLGIMAFFLVLYVVADPFGWDSTYTPLMIGIIVGSFGLLAVLTYVSGKVISIDEKRREAAGKPIEPGMAVEATAPEEAEEGGDSTEEGDQATDDHADDTVPAEESTADDQAVEDQTASTNGDD